MPVVTSVEARRLTSASEVPALLERQVTGPVRWEETVGALGAFGADLALEVGPGRTLTALMKRIAPAIAGIAVGDTDGIAKAREALA